MRVNQSKLIYKLFFALLIFPPFVAEAQEKLKIENITIVNHKNNVLRKQLTFETTKKTVVSLVWWKTGNPEQKQRISNQNAVKEHHFVVKYLKANREYQWQVETEFEKSEVYTFFTDSLPEDLPQLELLKTDSSFQGYILANSHAKPALLYLFDSQADILWYHYFYDYIRPFNFSKKGTVIGIRNHNEIFEIDFEGNELWKMSIQDTGDVEFLHHDIIESSEGWLFTLGKAEGFFDLTKAGGGSNTKVVTDKVIGIDREGSIKFEWSLFDEMHPADHPQILKYHLDMGHANGLTLDKDGHVLISYRFFDQVWKINRHTGKVDWKLGRNGDFKLEERAVFLKQHTPHITQDGKLMVFDNGEKGKRLYAQVPVFQINEATRQVDLLKSIHIPEYLSSLKRGSAFPLDIDKYLICSTGTKKIFIIKSNEQIIWEIASDKRAYRALPVKKLN